MGIIKRQGLKGSIVNYLGVIIGVVFFNFIFPHLVSEEHLGLINLLRNLTYVLGAIPTLGLAHVLLNHYNQWKNNEKENGYNSFAIIITSIALLIFTILYLLFKSTIISYYQHQSPLFATYFYAVIPLIIIFTYTQYFELFSLVKYRAAVPAFLREVLGRIILIFVFYLFAYHFISLNGLVWGLLISFLIPSLVLLIYNFNVLKFKFQAATNYYKNNIDLNKELKYGGAIYLLLIFGNLSNFMDGILLPMYLGLGTLGIYTPSLVLGQMIQIPYRAISLISIPVIRDALANKDIKKVEILNKDLAINLFLISCFLFVLLVGNLDGIFGLIPLKYSAAKNVLIIIAFGRLLDMAFGLNTEIITYSENYSFMIWLSAIFVVMTFLLNIFLIPKYGMNGAATAITISLIFYNIFKTSYIYYKYKFHCFSKYYIHIILISIVILAINYLIPYFTILQHHMFINSLLNIVLKSILLGTLFILPVYYFKISLDFNDFIKLILNGKIFKGGHKMEEL